VKVLSAIRAGILAENFICKLNLYATKITIPFDHGLLFLLTRAEIANILQIFENA